MRCEIDETKYANEFTLEDIYTDLAQELEDDYTDSADEDSPTQCNSESNDAAVETRESFPPAWIWVLKSLGYWLQEPLSPSFYYFDTRYVAFMQPLFTLK